MYKILTLVFLIIFTVQPVLSKGLVYRYSDLNILMNAKTEQEFETTNNTGRIVVTTVYSSLIGLLIGTIGGSLYGSITTSYDDLRTGYALTGAAFGLVGGALAGVYIGSNYDRSSKRNESDACSKIRSGMNKLEIIEIMGNPLAKRIITKKNETIYGAEKNFWDEVEIGTKLEIWTFLLDEGRLNLYFPENSDIMLYKAFTPKGSR